VETLPGQERLTILRRLIAYAEKIFHLSGTVVAGVVDRRQQPRIPTSRVVHSVAALFWAHLGSLNALELAANSNFFRRWLGQSVCSADSVGRVTALMDAEGLRRGLHHVYDRLKRNKALPDQGGLGVAVLDGHESHASYRRQCPGCLERTIRTGQTERTQYYHRQVTLMLLPATRPGCDPVRLLLDHEPQRAGEDEVATALRLLERVLGSYPRGFDLLLADALYSTAPLFNFCLARGKHVLTVLKDDRRNLYQDATALFAAFPATEGSFRSRKCLWWDFPGLLSWPQVNAPVRVIRSQETRTVRRQLDGKDETLTSDWIWVTTLPEQSVPTGRAVALGHQRWDIENHGFNELVNGWHADHIYRHDPNAIECFLLMAFLACNIFQAFFALNLKPQIRKRRTRAFWSSLMAAEILDGVNPTLPP
jgi:hypothetical protein